MSYELLCPFGSCFVICIFVGNKKIRYALELFDIVEKRKVVRPKISGKVLYCRVLIRWKQGLINS